MKSIKTRAIEWRHKVTVLTIYIVKGKGKVFFCGQEPPSGESSTAEGGVNHPLLVVIY